MAAGSAMSWAMPLMAAEQSFLSILVWSGILIAAVVLLFAAAMWVKRWARSDAPADAGGSGFTLADLREMHRRGQITDAEFERARARTLAATEAAVEKGRAARGGRGGGAGDDR